MALGCPLHRLNAVLMVHLMSGLGMGEGIPDHEPSHPSVGRGLSSPHPTPGCFRDEAFPGTLFGRGSALLSPARSLPAVASLSSSLGLLLQKGQRLTADG